MDPATIASVDKSDEAKVVATLVSAFIADPVERWLFAEPLQYLTQFARFVAAFGSGGFESETVFSLGDFAAVAIWMPPGTEADADAIVAVLASPSPRSGTRIRSRCSIRWMPLIPRICTGTCHGWVSTVLGREPAWERSYSSSVWPEWTRITCRRS